MDKTKRKRGFSLAEVLVGIFLVAVAVLGLAQIFLVAIANNVQADRITNATFLAQQQIDWLRGFTLDELSAYAGTTIAGRDEIIDLNQDGTNDFRRITELIAVDDTFQALVHVYSGENINALDPMTLVNDPDRYRQRALITTIITR